MAVTNARNLLPGRGAESVLMREFRDVAIDPSVFVKHTRLVPARLVWQHQV